MAEWPTSDELTFSSRQDRIYKRREKLRTEASFYSLRAFGVNCLLHILPTPDAKAILQIESNRSVSWPDMPEL